MTPMRTQEDEEDEGALSSLHIYVNGLRYGLMVQAAFYGTIRCFFTFRHFTYSKAPAFCCHLFLNALGQIWL